MDKIRDVLLLQKRELEHFSQKHYVPRDIELSGLHNDIIKVIIGPRRAGKSFFAIHELKKSGNFGYVNFDDEGLLKVENYNDIIENINHLYNNPKSLLLDEIQNLAGWELFVNRLQRQGYNLIITGSNSNLLSRELATHLTGRHISTVVFPFSFKEYLRYFDRDSTSSEIKIRLNDYLHKGGFPEPLVKDIPHKEYLKTLHDAIVFKDILKRHNLRSPRPMGDLSTYLISNSGSLVSYRKLASMIGLKSAHTINKYLGFFEEVFLFFQLRAFFAKYKKQVRSNKKVYTIDNGLINAAAFNLIENMGPLYENAVAVELKRRELNGELECFYYNTKQGYEVDFVIKKGLEITQLIQVCYNVEKQNTKNREVRALLHASVELKCNRLTVITADHENIEDSEWQGIKGKIEFVPLWKWLLH
ncbi:MAG: ATP-binding protein [Candidatus Aminicenantes bacterium]|nr:ATP-binding protein [Candidatus Aminicenantes bacterium]